MPDDLLDRLRDAYESQDVRAMGALLAPEVTWGAPGDPNPPCRSRRQVLEWYQGGVDRGVRGTLREISRAGDSVIVGLAVTGREEAGAPVDAVERWQVLALTDGLVSDIRGFEDRASALAYAAEPPS